MRHEHELIRDLGRLLRTRMSGAGHLMQAVHQEHRGNCPPARYGACTPACQEAQRLMALTEPYVQKARDLSKPLKPLPKIVLRRAALPEVR